MLPCQAVGEILMYLVMTGEGRSFLMTVLESALARKYCPEIKQFVTFIETISYIKEQTKGRGKRRIFRINLK